MEAVFTIFDDSSNWVAGKIGNYKFEAKLFDVGSEFGINNGRVSKLSIYDSAKSWIVNYDRGWDIEPETQEHKEVFNSIMELLENSPKRFDLTWDDN